MAAKQSYLEFLDLRDTNRIPREFTWADWKTLGEDERKNVLQKPGPVSVGASPDQSKQA